MAETRLCLAVYAVFCNSVPEKAPKTSNLILD